MCNNNCGGCGGLFGGSSCSWILIIILVLVCCGNGCLGGCNNGCGCNNTGCGC